MQPTVQQECRPQGQRELEDDRQGSEDEIVRDRPAEDGVVQGHPVVVQADEVAQGAHAAPVVEAVLGGNDNGDKDKSHEEHESRAYEESQLQFLAIIAPAPYRPHRRGPAGRHFQRYRRPGAPTFGEGYRVTRHGRLLPCYCVLGYCVLGYCVLACATAWMMDCGVPWPAK